MEVSTLNLARKWRSRTFDTIIGQDIVIKILKNSLYAAHYFPAYLFVGQRGCGKTSTARVFSAALNCQQLPHFQNKPKDVILPCGVCDSCSAMEAQSHPDFIEIDAASNTGVDNIRAIIDIAYYMPVLGRKKIYLIDEVHMLSKAAFNAFLKILEEPPQHAHFILATTDPDKIIDTVRSRCFTLFFDPIDTTVLAHHLRHLCVTEKIAHTEEALIYIAAHTSGSARDAINLLETVRFAHTIVTKESVLEVLGHVDDRTICELLEVIAQGDTKKMLQQWQVLGSGRISVAHIWSRLIYLIRLGIWEQYGVTNSSYEAEVVRSMHLCTRPFLQKLLHDLYSAEPLFIRTTDQAGLLEMILLQLSVAMAKKKPGGSSSGESGEVGVPSLESSEQLVTEETVDENDELEDEETGSLDNNRWQKVLEKVAQLEDPLVGSIVMQAVEHAYNKDTKQLKIKFPANHIFFTEILERSRELWHAPIAQIYGVGVQVEALFEGDTVMPAELRVTVKPAIPYPVEKEMRSAANNSVNTQTGYNARRKIMPAVKEKIVDVSDSTRWPRVNAVLHYFPGTVTVVDEVVRQ